MIPRPPRSNRTYTLVPSTRPFRPSRTGELGGDALEVRAARSGLAAVQALPGVADRAYPAGLGQRGGFGARWHGAGQARLQLHHVGQVAAPQLRSEEHTSELQSLMRISYAVFCLKKKKPTSPPTHTHHNK